MTMELLEAIQSRRSIRKFKSNEVPDEVIRELLDAARLRQAPICRQHGSLSSKARQSG